MHIDDPNLYRQMPQQPIDIGIASIDSGRTINTHQHRMAPTSGAVVVPTDCRFSEPFLGNGDPYGYPSQQSRHNPRRVQDASLTASGKCNNQPPPPPPNHTIPSESNRSLVSSYDFYNQNPCQVQQIGACDNNLALRPHLLLSQGHNGFSNEYINQKTSGTMSQEVGNPLPMQRGPRGTGNFPRQLDLNKNQSWDASIGISHQDHLNYGPLRFNGHARPKRFQSGNGHSVVRQQEQREMYYSQSTSLGVPTSSGCMYTDPKKYLHNHSNDVSLLPSSHNIKSPIWNSHPVYDDKSLLKQFNYVEHPDIANMTQLEVEDVYTKLQVFVQGSRLPKPIQSFEHAPFPNWIHQELKRAGYTEPYPIQTVGWPVALSGRDMIGIARTGSGKTLAYLLPAFLHLEHSSKRLDGPVVLILAPTRELAMQIEKEAKRFVSIPRIRVTCVFGGVPRRSQAFDLQRGVHLCIATPGRLIDFLETGTTHLRHVTYLVLDEADRMLDMGFEPQIRRIVSQIRPDRQTLMWSATWPREVQKLARDFCLSDPVKITVGAFDLQANENIKQIIQVCRNEERFGRLVNYLLEQQRHPDPSSSHTLSLYDKKTLIFCETKRGCDLLKQRLQATMNGLRIAAIHGDKEQRERDRILSDFKSGRLTTLIATDVASRGLDIKNIDLVLNFDVPKTIEDYIHRIGRTGRAGAIGTAVTFFSDAMGETERTRMAKDICTVMSDVSQTPPEELISIGNLSLNYSSHGHRYYSSGNGGGHHYPSRDHRHGISSRGGPGRTTRHRPTNNGGRGGHHKSHLNRS